MPTSHTYCKDKGLRHTPTGAHCTSFLASKASASDAPSDSPRSLSSSFNEGIILDFSFISFSDSSDGIRNRPRRLHGVRRSRLASRRFPRAYICSASLRLRALFRAGLRRSATFSARRPVSRHVAQFSDFAAPRGCVPTIARCADSDAVRCRVPEPLAFPLRCRFAALVFRGAWTASFFSSGAAALGWSPAGLSGWAAPSRARPRRRAARLNEIKAYFPALLLGGRAGFDGA